MGVGEVWGGIREALLALGEVPAAGELAGTDGANDGGAPRSPVGDLAELGPQGSLPHCLFFYLPPGFLLVLLFGGLCRVRFSLQASLATALYLGFFTLL